MAVSCRTAPDDVINELFAAAHHGGVNGPGKGQGGAYSRLYAWNSLYALMGLPGDLPFLDAARLAADYRWLRFMAFTDWFHHDTADVAFAALDPSGTRVAVLAATVTDADSHPYFQFVVSGAVHDRCVSSSAEVGKRHADHRPAGIRARVSAADV